MDQVPEVGGCIVYMEALVAQAANFVVNPGFNGEPVEHLQKSWGMICLVLRRTRRAALF